jgi:hypothetical protein
MAPLLLPIRRLTLGLLVATAAGLPACSSDKTPAASNALGADVIREGNTTSPALDEFLGTPADSWAWAGGQFVAPSDQAVLPADMPAAFSWQADGTTPPPDSDVLVPSEQQGQTFLLVFSTPSDAKLLRVFTSLTSYTPSAAAWQKLVRAGTPITLSITSATFENDQLTADGGPHNGQTIQFTIQ